MKNKKALWISLIAVDIAVTVFLFVIHIIMLASTVGKTAAEIKTNADNHHNLITFLQTHTTLYLWLFVIPLFVILAGNIVALVLYVRTQTKKEKVTVDNLSDEQKEALRKELLQDLQKEAASKEEAPKEQEEKPAEEKKE